MSEWAKIDVLARAVKELSERITDLETWKAEHIGDIEMATGKRKCLGCRHLMDPDRLVAGRCQTCFEKWMEGQE